jgi:hypothetical protein
MMHVKPDLRCIQSGLSPENAMMPLKIVIMSTKESIMIGGVPL